MTFVFRNRLDNDTGRQIFPPVPPANAIDTVAELKAALLVPGTYELAAGTYTANLVATVDNVSIHCLPGVIFNPVTNLDTPWAIRANHFSLTGDWTINASSRLAMEIGLTTNTLQSQQPDVVLIDGGTMTAPAAGCDRGISCHGSNVTITNCRVEGFYTITGSGKEAQAIWMNNTNGPITITDCFLEAAGENILSGGDGILIPNAVPSDVYVARNTIYKRPSWRPPSNRVVKNNFELKNAQRWIIEDNVCDGTWASAQSGNLFVLTVRNSTSAVWNWVIVNDITIRHNIGRNNYESGSFAVSILGHDDGGRTSEQTRTITITNNLFEDCTNGVQVNSGVTDLLLIDHNTFNGDIEGEIVQFVNHFTLTTIQLTKNVANQGAYGVLSVGFSGANVGNSLANACSTWTCTGNILGRNQTQNPVWPAGNTVIGPASTRLVLTAPPECALTGAQAGADCGWDANPAGIGINGDGTTTTGAP